MEKYNIVINYIKDNCVINSVTLTVKSDKFEIKPIVVVQMFTEKVGIFRIVDNKIISQHYPDSNTPRTPITTYYYNVSLDKMKESEIKRLQQTKISNYDDNEINFVRAKFHKQNKSVDDWLYLFNVVLSRGEILTCDLLTNVIENMFDLYTFGSDDLEYDFWEKFKLFSSYMKPGVELGDVKGLTLTESMMLRQIYEIDDNLKKSNRYDPSWLFSSGLRVFNLDFLDDSDMTDVRIMSEESLDNFIIAFDRLVTLKKYFVWGKS